MRTRPSVGWWAVAILESIIVIYALGYVVVGAPMYPDNFAASFLARPWGIYPHAFFGALALGLGPGVVRPPNGAASIADVPCSSRHLSELLSPLRSRRYT
jgi:hypothetical protein